jgi:hypothetical protein
MSGSSHVVTDAVEIDGRARGPQGYDQCRVGAAWGVRRMPDGGAGRPPDLHGEAVSTLRSSEGVR